MNNQNLDNTNLINKRNVSTSSSDLCSNKNLQTAVLTKKFTLRGKLTYFLSGMAISYGYLYFNFKYYLEDSEKTLNKEIDEIKNIYYGKNFPLIYEGDEGQELINNVEINEKIPIENEKFKNV